MLQLENTILSRDIFDKQFVCDLNKCKGYCCVEGDTGAPLELDECSILNNIIEQVKPYMSDKGIRAISEHGVYIFNEIANENQTPLIGKAECAYVYFKDKIAFCAIEKAYVEGKVDFRKPISCHLYPIRITKYNKYDAINYHKWSVCKDACVKGKAEKVILYDFLKEPLIRKYGEAWYKMLIEVGTELGWIEKKV